MKDIAYRHPDGSIHVMKSGITFRELLSHLKTQGLQLAGKQAAPGLYQAEPIKCRA